MPAAREMRDSAVDLAVAKGVDDEVSERPHAGATDATTSGGVPCVELAGEPPAAASPSATRGGVIAVLGGWGGGCVLCVLLLRVR